MVPTTQCLSLRRSPCTVPYIYSLHQVPILLTRKCKKKGTWKLPLYVRSFWKDKRWPFCCRFVLPLTVVWESEPLFCYLVNPYRPFHLFVSELECFSLVVESRSNTTFLVCHRFRRKKKGFSSIFRPKMYFRGLVIWQQLLRVETMIRVTRSVNKRRVVIIGNDFRNFSFDVLPSLKTDHVSTTS